MKVISIEKTESEIIETENNDWNTYRRCSSDNWEVVMGQSWEPLYDCWEIEEAYQTFKKKGK